MLAAQAKDVLGAAVQLVPGGSGGEGGAARLYCPAHGDTADSAPAACRSPARRDRRKAAEG